MPPGHPFFDILKTTVKGRCVVSEKIEFSVSMCVWAGDDPDFFDAAIESISEQTVQPTEVVLTVDGPIPEKTKSVIKKYRDTLPRKNIGFKVVYLEKNVGHGEARRVCFENCTCDLIALMDADDLSLPDRFEKQLDIFKRDPDTSVVGGNIREFIGDPDNCVGRRIVPETDSEIKEYLKKRCPMNQITVMFKKAAVEEAGGYIDWFCEEDYYLWLRMSLIGKKFANVQYDLANVRVGEDMYSRRGGLKYFKSEAKLQRYMLKNGVIGLPRYLINVSERFILQVMMPNKIRGFLFRKFARS